MPLRNFCRCALLVSVIFVFPLSAQAAAVGLSASSGSIQLGQSVTLTAVLTPTTASGVVTFYDGPYLLGTGKIGSGAATLITRALTSGSRLIRAYYGGDSSNGPATSGNVQITVTGVHGFGFGSLTSTGVRASKIIAADFNGDGITDFAIENTVNAGFVVLLGNGDGTYQNLGTFGATTWQVAQGFVAADFNSDGIVDILGPAYNSGGFVLFPGNGDGTFQAPISYLNNSVYANSLTVGDFNGDGKPDVAVTNAGDVGVYLGNGDGTFQPIVTYPVGVDPSSVTVGDFNGDNKPDLVVVDGQEYSISVLMGNGDGTFQAAKSFGTGREPLAAAVGDFNGDGKADVATVNAIGGTVSVLLGNGDGTFQAASTYTVGSNPWSIAAGDFNADGKTDLVVGNLADYTNTSLSLLAGNGDGTFQTARTFATTGDPYAFVVGDFNGDGRADIAVASSLGFGIQAGIGPPDLAITGSHTGIFASGEPGAQYTITVTNLGPGWSDDAVAVSDALPSIMTASAIGGSGWNCALSTVSCTRSDAVAPGAAYPNVTVTANVATVAPETVTNTVSVSAASGDPNPANNTASDATVIGLAQTITFAAIPDHSLLDPPFTVTATASTGLPVSFSATGSCGVSGNTVTIKSVGTCSVTATQAGNTIYGPGSLTRTFNIVPGISSITLTASPQSPVLLGTQVTLTATISPANSSAKVTFYDGVKILGTASMSSGVASVSTSLLGAGNHKLRAYCAGLSSSTVALSVTALAGSFPSYNQSKDTGATLAIALGDMNGDGIPDVAVAYSQYNTAGIMLGDGKGNFSTAVDYAAGQTPKSIALADFNGDGQLDVVVANFPGAAVLLGNGNGTFRAATTYTLGGQSGSQGYSVVVADFDGDGNADFAVAFANSWVVVMLGNGDGTFRNAGTYATNSKSSTETGIALAVEDFNGDGKPDLAVTDAANLAVSVLLGNGDGTFQAASSYSAGGAPLSIALGDLNGDGAPDVVVGLNGQVAVLPGNGTGGLLAPHLQTAASQITAVALGDFNGDGKLDVAAAGSQSGTVVLLLGNGDGTLQTGSNVTTIGNPTSVLVADVNGDHKSDLIEGLDVFEVNVSLSMATPSQFFFTAQPNSATVGVAVAPITVQISDRYDQAIAGLAVPVTLTSNPAGINVTVTTVNGVATFSNLVFNTTGTYTLTATTAGFPPAFSYSFLVNVGGNNVLVTGQAIVSGVGLSGVTINVNGSQTSTTTTDALGNYSAVLVKGSSYTVSASLAGYVFSGPVTLSNVTTIQTANFVGFAVTGLEFYPVTPCRLVDTRVSSFPAGFGPPSMSAGSTRTFTIPSNTACGIPANAAAYSLNVTAVTKGYLGILSIWPTGQTLPNVSTLNSYSTTGTAVANAAIVPAGPNGAINVYVTDPTDLILDINGYFAPPAANGFEFYPVTPCRLVDTRVSSFPSGFGPPSMNAGATRSFTIPADTACAIPSTAAAYSLNVTAIPRTTLGLLSIWPTGQPLPNVSTLNVYTAGTVVANAAIVPAGINGAINTYVSDATDVVIDINGYFAPVSTSGLKLYPATPCRVADTRVSSFPANLGPPSMSAGTQRSFPVPLGTCGIPNGAGAYSFNFTAVPQAPQLGVFITWPTGLGQPNVSTMNSYNGSVVSNAAFVPAGTGGAISIYVTDLADVLFDVNGYFAP